MSVLVLGARATTKNTVTAFEELLLKTPGKNPFSYLFQLLEAAHILGLTAPSLSSKLATLNHFARSFVQ